MRACRRALLPMCMLRTWLLAKKAFMLVAIGFAYTCMMRIRMQERHGLKLSLHQFHQPIYKHSQPCRHLTMRRIQHGYRQ